MWRVFSKPFMNAEKIFPTQQRDVQKIVEKCIEDLNVQKLIVFGSSVTSACNPWDDIDIYIELDHGEYWAPALSTEATVDKHTNRIVDKSMYDEIIRNGVVVFDRTLCKRGDTPMEEMLKSIERIYGIAYELCDEFDEDATYEAAINLLKACASMLFRVMATAIENRDRAVETDEEALTILHEKLQSKMYKDSVKGLEKWMQRNDNGKDIAVSGQTRVGQLLGYVTLGGEHAALLYFSEDEVGRFMDNCPPMLKGATIATLRPLVGMYKKLNN